MFTLNFSPLSEINYCSIFSKQLNQLIEEKEKMALLLKAKEEEMTELKNETENLSPTNKNSEVETDSVSQIIIII